MKDSIFKFFRSCAKKFSGHKIREKIPLVNYVFNKLNKLLSPPQVYVFDNLMNLDDKDSMGLAVKGVYEPTETVLIKRLVKPGANVVDVGANIGYYTLIMARLVGPEGKVFAIEPDPQLFSLLKSNVDLNNYKNVVLSNKGLSNQNSQAILYLDKYYNLDNRIYESDHSKDKVKIELMKFDDYIIGYTKKIDFIKMDIQGAEGLAFQGMQKVFESNPQIEIVTEFWPNSLSKTGTKPFDFLVFFENLGFSFFDINMNINLKVSKEWLLDTYNISNNKQTNLYCVRI